MLPRPAVPMESAMEEVAWARCPSDGRSMAGVRSCHMFWVLRVFADRVDAPYPVVSYRCLSPMPQHGVGLGMVPAYALSQ